MGECVCECVCVSVRVSECEWLCLSILRNQEFFREPNNYVLIISTMKGIFTRLEFFRRLSMAVS